MSLHTVFSEEKTQKIIAVMPDELVVWKIVTDGGEFGHTPQWFSQFNHGFNERAGLCRFHSGVFVAQQRPIVTKDRATVYMSGLHAWVKKGGITWSALTCEEEISCLIKKDWITFIGLAHELLAVVCSHMTFPAYPNIDILKEIDTEPIRMEEHEETMQLCEVL